MTLSMRSRSSSRGTRPIGRSSRDVATISGVEEVVAAIEEAEEGGVVVEEVDEAVAHELKARCIELMIITWSHSGAPGHWTIHTTHIKE